MTTPGVAVGEQAIPSKVSAKPQRHAGSQADGAATANKAEAEFSQLLSKMQNPGDRPFDESGQALPEERPQPTEGKAARGRASKREAGAEDGDDGQTSLRTAVNHLSRDFYNAGATREEEAAEQPEPEARSDDGAKKDAVANKEAVAISTLTPSPALQSGEQPRPEQAPRAQQALPADVEVKVVSDEAQGADTRMAGQVARTAKVQVEQKDDVKPPAMDDDLSLSTSATEPSPDKETQPAITRPIKSDDLPKANVVRQEVHFAPVATSDVASRAEAAASTTSTKAGGPGLDAKQRSEPLAAPSTGELPVAQQAPLAAPARPAEQIADHIATSAGEFESAGSVRPEVNQAGGPPPLKVLQIQLQPVELGTVTVRLELKQDELEVHVETSRKETADIIRNDKDTLSNLLRASGYGVDPSSIRVVDGDRTGASAQLGQQGAQPNLQSSTQSQSGWSQRGEGTHQENPNAKNRNAVPENRNDADGTTSNRVGGSLYV